MRNKILLISALIALVGTPALAFHDGGVADCQGCHTMHNSQNDAGVNELGAGGPGSGELPGQGYPQLLLFNNRTDVCLNCHARTGRYGVWADDMSAPGAEHGAGNFVWIEEDNINDGHGGGDGTCTLSDCDGTPGDPVLPCDSETVCEGAGGSWDWDNAISGHAAGHTLASGIKNTLADEYLDAAPGGTYPDTELTCTSCHDPHGNDGFRLLYKDGQQSVSAGGAVVTYDATMEALGISATGATEAEDYHNAYEAGYSAWCGNCHGDFHGKVLTTNWIHPSGSGLTVDEIAVYNSYRGTTDCIADSPTAVGDPCGTISTTDAYTAVVPFEWDGAIAAGTASTVGPVLGTSRVACVSCHRAHGTSAMDAGRWDFQVTGLAEDGVESNSYKIPMPAPYDDGFQRSMCNKCHGHDEFDTAEDFTP